jgi:endonuclease/exonuclease/phosphatase family metal-dependent hydrolase
VKPLLVLLLITACRTGRDYPDPAGPRYANVDQHAAASARGDTLLIVSFNIEFSREVQGAIRVLRAAAPLRDADVLLLQEMTAAAARSIADSLRMAYVYYPAIYNRVYRRDVGNAILSRWPIAADAKLILPSRSRYAKTQRIATAATIRLRETLIRVYSTHLGTPADLGKAGREAQLQFILADAEPFTHVILGGDMNSSEIGEVARRAGYAWPTGRIPRSNNAGRLDHIFVKGIAPVGEQAAGTVASPPSISDHRPIWIRATLNVDQR